MMMLKIYVRRLTKNIKQSNTIYEIEKKNFYLANSFFQSTIKLLPTDPWILHSHRNNNIVKYLHERCLWLIYNDNSSSFLQQMQTQYNLRIHSGCRTPSIRPLLQRSQNISFLGPKIWNALPPDLTQLEL